MGGNILTDHTRTRDYLFDNCKALLILLVVIGHFIEPSYKDNTLLYVLKWFIFSFHMPAFIFISGYFSKRELTVGALIRKLAIPYLVYEMLYYLLYTCIIHKPAKLDLLLPKFSLWYILALLIWRLITPYVKRIPYHLILSVIAGLLIGCSNMPDNFLSIPRILVYYPFFLTGMYCSRDRITALRTPLNRVIAAAGTIAFLAVLIFTEGYQSLPVKIFYGRYNYDYLGQDILTGILCRIVCYGIGAFMTYAVLVLMTERKTLYSYIGTRTMAIYLFHGLIYSWLKGSTQILENISTIPEALLLTGFCICLTGILSIPQLTAFTNRIADLQFVKPSFNRLPTPYAFLFRTLSNPKA